MGLGSFNFTRNHEVRSNSFSILWGWWCKSLLVILTLEIVSSSTLPRGLTHIEFNDHMPIKVTQHNDNLGHNGHNLEPATVGHLHALNLHPAFVGHLPALNLYPTSVGHLTGFNLDSASVGHLHALNLDHESAGDDSDREGKLLGILGNWGYGYPGFGKGAYGGLCKGKRKASTPRCRPGLGPKPFEYF